MNISKLKEKNNNIDNEKRFINIYDFKCIKDIEFIHITKTGGTSIENWGIDNNIKWSYKKKEYFESFQVSKFNIKSKWHIPPQFFIDNPYKNKKTFTIVRNPYNRLISEFYCNFDGYKDCNNCSKDDFNLWIKNLVNNKTVISGLPQYLYMPCDYILKFENLQEDFTNFIRNYDDKNILNTTLPHSNKGKYINNNKFTINDLSSENIELINNYYNKDFELFNYKKYLY